MSHSPQPCESNSDQHTRIDVWFRGNILCLTRICAGRFLPEDFCPSTTFAIGLVLTLLWILFDSQRVSCWTTVPETLTQLLPGGVHVVGAYTSATGDAAETAQLLSTSVSGMLSSGEGVCHLFSILSIAAEKPSWFSQISQKGEYASEKGHAIRN